MTLRLGGLAALAVALRQANNAAGRAVAEANLDRRISDYVTLRQLERQLADEAEIVGDMLEVPGDREAGEGLLEPPAGVPHVGRGLW